MAERERAVAAIMAFGEELRRTMREPGPATNHAEPELDVLAGAFLRGCERAGVSAEEVRAAIEHDRSLLELEESVTKDASSPNPDPGPYDTISRESPSGNEDNEHLNQWLVGAKFHTAPNPPDGAPNSTSRPRAGVASNNNAEPRRPRMRTGRR